MAVPQQGLSQSEMSWWVAKQLAVAIDDAEVNTALVGALASAPVGNLQSFRSRGGAVAFAESFSIAANSEFANERRRRPLSADERAGYVEWDRFGHNIYGLYDPSIDSLIFCDLATPADPERVVLHELGHALTVRTWWRTAHLRSDLLQGLPEQIDALLEPYAQGFSPDAICERVLEVLAESYLWALVGRHEELPDRLRTIALRTLSGESDAEDAIRLGLARKLAG